MHTVNFLASSNLIIANSLAKVFLLLTGFKVINLLTNILRKLIVPLGGEKAINLWVTN